MKYQDSQFKFLAVIFFIIVSLGFVFLLKPKNVVNRSLVKPTKPKVVATLYPIYDFIRRISSDKIEVVLIPPPGIEVHEFEPKLSDIKSVKDADLVFYTSDILEPWIKRADITNDKLINLSANIKLTNNDPHYWLKPSNALIMIDDITHALAKIDSKNSTLYKQRSEKLKKQILEIDTELKQNLVSCKTRTIYHAGHFAFGYLANAYSLDYKALQGFSPEGEIKMQDVANLIKELKSENVKSIFVEESIDAKVAKLIGDETGAKIYHLNSAHEINSDDFNNKVTYVEIMRRNLENLKKGLGCR
ncbi:MAG: metal ABC transporter substrate-binding protein [Patescibacteria group bacterium]